MELWAHQKEAISRAKDVDFFALLMDPGVGKTLTAIRILEDKIAKHGPLRTLILTPLVVVSTWKREFDAFSTIDKNKVHALTGPTGFRADDYKGTPEKEIFITNYDALRSRKFCDALFSRKPELVILDECFVPGTIIDTPTGGKRIEKIKQGDYIIGATGEQEVVHTKRVFKDTTVYVTFGGVTIECSKNHPWFTSRGWISAGQLNEGDLLAKTNEIVCMVQKEESKNEDNTFLREELFCEMEDVSSLVYKKNSHRRNAQKDWVGPSWAKVPREFLAYETKKPDEEKGNQGKGVRDIKKDGVAPHCSMRKRSRSNEAGKNSFGAAGEAVEMEPCNFPWEESQRIPDMLQGGYWSTDCEISHRSRRIHTLFEEKTRQKKREKTGWIRVERVEIQECRSFGRYRQRDFYDLQVSNHPSYTVNNVLVHNSHMIKNSKASRTEWCIKLGDVARFRYILTGTAVLNTILDLYTQFRFLMGKDLTEKELAVNWFAFRYKYCYDANQQWRHHQNYFANWKMKKGAEKEVSKIIDPYCIKTKKEGAIDLPDFVSKKVLVSISKEQQKIYETMKKDFIVYLEDRACVASIALTKLLRLQQIISGHVKFEDGGIKELADNPKLDALEELLVEIIPHEKVIVWAVFKEDFKKIASLCEKMKIAYSELHGEITKKDEALKEFNEGESRVMIAHPGAGGIGISMVPASCSIWFSRNFSLGQDIQANARNFRGGSSIHKKVTRIDIVMQDTVDEKILDVLEKKRDLKDSFMEDTIWQMKALL